MATPHVFLFDKDRKLRYEGRVDSNQREELATKHEARDAIEALLAGKPVAVEHTPAVGCSTKWAYKEAGTKAELAKEAAEPVNVELTSAEQLKTIRKNAGTDKLLLVNFWATWCGPCVGEFPELQKMVRQFRARQINIVTLSVNAPDEKDMVLSFLKKEHAFNRNLLFNSNDAAEAAPAFNARLVRRRSLYRADRDEWRTAVSQPRRHGPDRSETSHSEIFAGRPLQGPERVLEQLVLDRARLLLQIRLEQLVDPLVFVRPARGFFESVILNRVHGQFPVVLVQLDQALRPAARCPRNERWYPPCRGRSGAHLSGDRQRRSGDDCL